MLPTPPHAISFCGLLRTTPQYAPALGVKAAGGVTDRASAEAMIAAGATRLGTSSGVVIVKGQTATARY